MGLGRVFVVLFVHVLPGDLVEGAGGEERVGSSEEVLSVVDSVPEAAELREDFGQLSAVLADEFPDDRLALTVFRMDYNFSLYSYERFYTRVFDEIVLYDGPGLGLDQYNWLDRNAVHTLFWDDIDLFTSLAETKPNFGYFIPFYRETNNSHCVTVPGLEELPLCQPLFETPTNRWADWSAACGRSGDGSLEETWLGEF